MNHTTRLWDGEIVSFLIGNTPSPCSYNNLAHHHCHNHYHHHHHNHLHQQSSSIIIIFYLSWLQQGPSTISCPKLSQGTAAWGLSAKDYAPNILQRSCTKYFAKIMHQIFSRDYAPNIFQRICTKYLVKIMHQIFCKEPAPNIMHYKKNHKKYAKKICKDFKCREPKIMQQI